MAPTPHDDPMPPRRSRRATLALVASFVIATAMAIFGHLDRLGNIPPDADRPDLEAPAGDFEAAPRLASVAVGVSAGIAVGVDVGGGVEFGRSAALDAGRSAAPGAPAGRNPRRAATGSARGTPAESAFDDPVAGVVVNGRDGWLGSDDVNVHLVAPVAWKQALAPGSAFQFRVDQTGRDLQGRVLSLDENNDPARRTVRVVGALVDDDPGLQPGMSGSARFGQRATPSAR